MDNSSSSFSGKVLSIPTRINTQWRYAFSIEESLPVSQAAAWETSIVESHTSENISIIVVSGFPTDLVWASSDPEKHLSVITIREDGLWLNYNLNSGTPTSIIQDALRGESLGEHIFLPTPRINDSIPQDPDTPRYAWRVVDEVVFQGQKGWQVSFITNPDHCLLDFVPGFGFVRFEYVHHGTVQHVTAELMSLDIPD
jgi:hypothetical protein